MNHYIQYDVLHYDLVIYLVLLVLMFLIMIYFKVQLKDQTFFHLL